MRVLILDDQRRYTQALARALGSAFEVSSYERRADAIDAVSHIAPDVVIADVCLDEGDITNREGVEFIAAARRLTNAPIVAMSALDTADVERECLDAGADCFLRKPVTVTALKARLAELTAQAGRRQ
jgi:DNA-binding response OmpR family regulator